MPVIKDFHVKTEMALRDVAAELAHDLEKGTVVALEGDLGAGKTALARALVRHMANDPDADVPSPTFTLLQTYDTPRGPVWHYDLYRLKSPEEVFELGWEDALATDGIVLVEWAGRIGALLPLDAVRITIDPQPDGSRRIKVHA